MRTPERPRPAAARGLEGVRCCVLGATGFIGKNLVRALGNAGAVVQAFARTPQGAEDLDPEVPFLAGDFGCERELAQAVAGQEVVFHLISTTLPEASNRDPAGDLASNVLATVRLLDLCRREGAGKVVFASSGGTVYGVPQHTPIAETAPTDPITAYGIGKLAIEKYLGLYRHLHGLDYQVVRISNPYGPHQPFERPQGFIGVAMRRLLLGQPVEIWGDGNVVRDFIHIGDVAAALLAAATYAGPCKVLNVGSGVGRSLNEVLADLEAALELPAPAVKVYRPGRPAEVPVNVLDISLIARETGWRPEVDWHDGLRATAAWLRSR